MTTEITHINNHRAISAGEATRIQASWRELHDRSISGPKEIEKIKAQMARMKRPAKLSWIAGRVTGLLSHYFVSSLPADVMEGVIDDWVAALEGYPEWAIAKACAWWMGVDNPIRRNRPLPGDIAEHVQREMRSLRTPEIALELHGEGRAIPLRRLGERDNG